MTLKELIDKEINTDQLDSLFASIGWRSRGLQKWQEVLEKSDFVYSFCDDELLIGLGRIVEDGVMCMFYDIGVHPDYQRKGFGKKIMETLIDRVKDKDTLPSDFLLGKRIRQTSRSMKHSVLCKFRQGWSL